MRRALVVLVLAALVAPGTARAHLRTGRVAVDHRASVDPLHPPLAGAVDTRVFRTDLAIRLRALGGHRVIVLGYFGEPFLRLEPDGVWVNDASLTASGSGLTPAHASGHGPRWRRRSPEPSVTWHDARLRGVRNGPWAIPVAVDGQRAQIRGEITRARVPPAWLWVGIGVLLAAATALLLARRSIEQIRNAAGWLGWIAALATLASAIGFAAAPTAAEGIWVEGANEIVLALVGVAFLIRGSRNAKAIAGGLLGLLALAVGLTKLPDLTHGVVLPRCPASSRAWR